MTMNLRPLLLLAFVLLTGCASGPDRISQQLTATPPEQHAYLLGNFVVTCKPNGDRCDQAFNSISLYLRDSNAPKDGRRLFHVSGSVFVPDTKYDFVDKQREERGFSFCLPLPAGDYEFFSYDFINFAGGGSGFSIPADKRFRLPVKLQPGEAVHVGRLKLSTEVGKNLLGMDRSAPGVLKLSKEPAAVEQQALAKCPASAQGRTVRSAPLDITAANGNPLVELDQGR